MKSANIDHFDRRTYIKRKKGSFKEISNEMGCSISSLTPQREVFERSRLFDKEDARRMGH